MINVKIKGKLYEALKELVDEKCINISLYVRRAIKERLEREGITIGKSDAPSKITDKSD